jgi:Lrp/AsnC family transcriptional regulator for asnA, asnC and gidA
MGEKTNLATRVWRWQGQETSFVAAAQGKRGHPSDDHALRPGSAAELTAADLELIRHLQRDGRITFVELAQVLNMAEKTVRKRVAELREKGLIEITAVTDPRLFGYASVAMIGLRLEPGRIRSDVARELFQVPSIDYVVTTKGRYDLLIEVLCTDDAALSRVIDVEIRGRPGVVDAEVFSYLHLHYQQPSWDAAQAKPTERASVPRTFEVDAVDMHIVRQLSEDGRAKFLEIARQLDVSEGQIRQRFARLTGSGALRLVAIVNPRSLGYGTTAWLCISVAPGHAVSAVADRLAGLPSVAYLAVCAGRFDILAEVVCRDKDDLFQLLDRDVRRSSDIARLESLLCDDLFYRRVMPAPGK